MNAFDVEIVLLEREVQITRKTPPEIALGLSADDTFRTFRGVLCSRVGCDQQEREE